MVDDVLCLGLRGRGAVAVAVAVSLYCSLNWLVVIYLWMFLMYFDSGWVVVVIFTNIHTAWSVKKDWKKNTWKGKGKKRRERKRLSCFWKLMSFLIYWLILWTLNSPCTLWKERKMGFTFKCWRWWVRNSQTYYFLSLSFYPFVIFFSKKKKKTSRPEIRSSYFELRTVLLYYVLCTLYIGHCT